MRLALFSLFTLALAVGCAPSADTSPDDAADEAVVDEAAAVPDTMATAQAEIAELDGSGVSGVVTFTQQADETILVTYNVTGLTPGLRGFHVHENGDCGPGEDGTPGGAAGGHFNPGGHEHGAPTDATSERHMGDLGNIEADADGNANGSFVDDVLVLAEITGKAMMIHEGEDDLTSQPTGAAGGRVGCGLIERMPGGDAM